MHITHQKSNIHYVISNLTTLIEIVKYKPCTKFKPLITKYIQVCKYTPLPQKGLQDTRVYEILDLPKPIQ